MQQSKLLCTQNTYFSYAYSSMYHIVLVYVPEVCLNAWITYNSRNLIGRFENLHLFDEIFVRSRPRPPTSIQNAHPGDFPGNLTVHVLWPWWATSHMKIDYHMQIIQQVTHKEWALREIFLNNLK